MLIDFDLDNSPLEIKTDSTLESYEIMKVYFYTPQGHNAGGVDISFRPSPMFYLDNCFNSWASFSTDLPTDTDNDKVWRITLTRSIRTSGIRLVIHCNDKEVVNVLMSDTTCGASQWNNIWSKEIKKIKFLSASASDTASDFYRRWQSFSPGKTVSTIYSTNLNLETSMKYG